MPQAAAALDLTEARSDALLRAQVYQLYEHANFGILATVVNSLILIGILRNSVEPSALTAWGALLALLTLARYVHSEVFRRYVSRREFDERRWLNYFLCGIAAAGVLWGASGILLFPDSLAHQTFIGFVLGGMVAGAAATFAIRMDAFLAFTIPALLPLIVTFFLLGDELHVAMGSMVFLFGILLSGVAYRVNCLFTESLHMRYELKQIEVASIPDPASAEGAPRPDAQRSQTPTFDSDLGDRLRQHFTEFTEALRALETRAKEQSLKRSQSVAREVKTESLLVFARGLTRAVGRQVSAIRSRIFQERRGPDHRPDVAPSETLKSIDAAAREIEGVLVALSEYGSDGGFFRAQDINRLIGEVTHDWAIEQAGVSGIRVSASTDRSAVDVKRLMGEVVREWAAEKDGAPQVRIAAGKDLPEVVLDEAQVGGALRELLVNALESGGPAVQIRVVSGLALPQEIDRGRAALPLVDMAPLYVFVGVEDDGLGISDYVKDRMFDPFFTTRQLGRGLGLATVSSVVRRHRGTIVVDSSPLGGCRVRLYLPIQSYRALATAIEEEAELESTLVEIERNGTKARGCGPLADRDVLPATSAPPASQRRSRSRA